METCFVNLVSPGDKVIVCVNGVFGGRMAENVRRLGGVAVIVEDPWGAPVDPAKVEEAFAANPDAALFAFVHAETSTGALSDAATLAAIARRHGALTIMDCVTSSAVCRSCSTSGASMRPIRAARSACHAPRPVAGEFFGGRGGAHQGRKTPARAGSRIWAWCWATGAAPSAPTTTRRRSIRCMACTNPW
jgi:hypothetical protein